VVVVVLVESVVFDTVIGIELVVVNRLGGASSVVVHVKVTKQ